MGTRMSGALASREVLRHYSARHEHEPCRWETASGVVWHCVDDRRGAAML